MRTVNYILISFITASSLFVAGCAEEGILTSNGGTITANHGIVSQKHFFIGIDPVSPVIVDLSTNTVFQSIEVTITATVADRHNQLLTSAHTVYFETSWGIFTKSSCITKNGECSVTWRSTDITTSNYPAFLISNIVAYTIGEEGFNDLDNNGIFDNNDTYIDNEEPWIDFVSDFAPAFDITADLPINVINGNDLQGTNLVHDIPDGFFNGRCAHLTDCSLVLRSATVWDSYGMDLTGGTLPP